jgi:hypothetical protein
LLKGETTLAETFVTNWVWRVREEGLSPLLLLLLQRERERGWERLSLGLLSLSLSPI